ncbi:MAG TPA: RIP metalloprotease RseP [Bryobacteraceae bacterium]|nr:RIP metalloprotease RseP [Bryobacteraceae bacterium]
MAFFQSAFWFLILIGVMILIHELGHFWAARFFDVRVETFSFGFGPRLFGFRRGETDYRVSAVFFLGGFVKMAGEIPGDETANDPRGFVAKPRWQRLIIVLAGPLMNVVLAVGLLTGLYMIKYQKVVDADSGAVVGSVAPNTPAAKAGIQDGDRIVKLDGKRDPTWDDIILKEVESASRPMRLTILRNASTFDTTVTPVLDERSGAGSAGWSEKGEVQLGPVTAGMPAQKVGLQQGDLILSAGGHPIHATVRFHEVIRGSGGKPVLIEFQRNGKPMQVTVQPVWSGTDGPARWVIGAYVEPKLNIVTTRLSLPDALHQSVTENTRSAGLIFQVLEGVVERRISAKLLTGPVGIAQMSGQAARQGPSAFIMLMSMVSLNLAVINLMPLPILDGGSVVMLIIEMVMRRDLSMSVKEAVFKVGFVFIMMLVAFVLYNDITKILPAG